MPEPAGGGFESLQRPITGTERILAELSRPSEFRFPETETVSTENPVRLEGYNAASSKDLALTKPFGLLMCASAKSIQIKSRFRPSICSVA